MTTNPTPPKSLQVTSTAYSEGQRIPRRHTCDDADLSPPLRFAGVPREAKTLAVIFDDPDAPAGTWTHWTIWNLSARVAVIAEGADVAGLGARLGVTSNGQPGYHGPCPPPGTHRYFLKVFALSDALDLKSGAKVNQLRQAMDGKILAWGELMGTYSRA